MSEFNSGSESVLHESNLLSPQPVQRRPSPGMGGMNPISSPFSGVKEPLRRARAREMQSVSTDLVNISTEDFIKEVSEHEKHAVESSSCASTSSTRSSPSTKDGDLKPSAEDTSGVVHVHPIYRMPAHDGDVPRVHPPPSLPDEFSSPLDSGRAGAGLVAPYNAYMNRINSAPPNSMGGGSSGAAPLRLQVSGDSAVSASPQRLTEHGSGKRMSLSPPPRPADLSGSGAAQMDHAAIASRRYSTNSISTPLRSSGDAGTTIFSPSPAGSLVVKVPAITGAPSQSSSSVPNTPQSASGSEESPMKSFVSVKQLTNQLIQAKNEANRLNRKIKELTTANEEMAHVIAHHDDHHKQHFDLHQQEQQRLREQLEAERQLHYRSKEVHAEELNQTKEEHQLERRQLRESLQHDMKQEGHSKTDYVTELEEMNLSYGHEIERLKEQLSTEQKLHGFTKTNYEEQLAQQQVLVDEAEELAKTAVAAQHRAQTELLTVQSVNTDLQLQLEVQAAEFKLRSEEAHVMHLQEVKSKLNEERRVHEKAEAQLLFQEKQRSKEQLAASEELCKGYKSDYDALLPRYTAEKNELIKKIHDLVDKLNVVADDNASYVQNNEQLNVLVKKQKADTEKRIAQMEASYHQQQQHMNQMHAQELRQVRDEFDASIEEAGLEADAHIAELELNHRQSERNLNVTMHKLQLDIAEKDKTRLKLINDYEAKLQRAYDSSSVAVSKAIDETIRVLLRDYGIGNSMEDDPGVDAEGNPIIYAPDAGTPIREAAITKAINRFAEDDSNKLALQRKTETTPVQYMGSPTPASNGNFTPTQGIMKSNSKDIISDDKSPSVRFAAKPHVITYEAPDSGSSGEDSDNGSRARLSASSSVASATANRPYSRKDTPPPAGISVSSVDADDVLPHVTRKPTGFIHSASSSSSNSPAHTGESPIGRLRKIVSSE